MSPRTFTRTRIRGVSFHHQSSAIAARGSRKEHSHQGHYGWNGPQLSEIQATAPLPFSNSDLHRLLGDQGRQEIHSLVSDAIDRLSQLRLLSQSVQRFAPESEVDRKFLQLETVEEPDTHPLRELFVEVNRLQRLWRLRLEILEMIVMAQNSLRGFPTKFEERLQQRVVKSAPKKR